MTKQVTTTAPKAITLDFKVNQQTGEAFISMKKTAELVDVPRTTLRDYIAARHPVFDTKQGLTAEILQETATHYAVSGNQKAAQLLGKLAEAGAKAFIYHEAGYTVSASPVSMMALPQDYIAALEQLVKTEKEKILLLEENHEKRIETDCSDAYFTVRKVRSINLDLKIDPKPLLRVSEEMEMSVKKVFDLYEQQANAYNRLVWEEVYPDAILPE